MDHEIHVAVRFHIASGSVGLNKIVYRLQEIEKPLMIEILKHILIGYDELIKSNAQ